MYTLTTTALFFIAVLLSAVTGCSGKSGTRPPASGATTAPSPRVLRPQTIAPWPSGSFELLGAAKGQENGTVIADGSKPDAPAGDFIRTIPGVLKPGHRYRATATYRILSNPADRAQYLFLVIRSNGGKWFPVIECAPDFANPTARASHHHDFVIPDDGKQYQLALALRGPVHAVVESLTIDQLPVIEQSRGLDATGVVLPKFTRPYEPYGMCVHADRLWQYSDEMIERAVPMWADAGIQWVRIGMSWGAFEPTASGGWDAKQIARTDRLLELCRKHGVKVYGIIGGQPRWASSNPQHPMSWAFEPEDLDRFRAFVRFAVQKYGKQIDTWEIGNEPNWAFWQSGIPAYMRWAKAAAEVIRTERPQSVILNGGFADAGLHGIRIGPHLPNTKALQEMAAHGFNEVFDVISVHFYAEDPEAMLYDLNSFYAQVHALGLAHKPIWITETGFSTVKDRTELQQARWVSEAYELLLQHPSVEKVFYYNFRQKVEEKDPRESGFGIVTADLTPRPAYEAYRVMPKHKTPPHNPCLLALDRWMLGK